MFAIAMPWICMPLLFNKIISDLNLTIVQLGIIWGMGPLAIAISALPAGLLGDRIGVPRTTIIACGLAAVAGALRGTSNNFVTLAAFMFLFGFAFAMVISNLSKVSLIFPKSQLGIANGILGSGTATGFAVGVSITGSALSLLRGWREVLFLYAGISGIFAIIWFLSVRGRLLSNSRDSSNGTASFSQSLSTVIHIKRIWLCSLGFFGQAGCFMGVIHYLPLYLQDKVGEVTAGGVISTIMWAGVIGNVLLPYISDRIGSTRVVYILSALITCIFSYLLSVATGLTLWVVAIIGGLAVQGAIPVLFAALLETKELKPLYAATALGAFATIAYFGSFLSPIIGDVLVSIEPSRAFIFWACLPIIPMILFARFSW